MKLSSSILVSLRGLKRKKTEVFHYLGNILLSTVIVTYICSTYMYYI